jgi:hypothetical protein
MTLKTLADVRKLVRHLPAERRKLNTWRHVAKQLAALPMAATSMTWWCRSCWCCSSSGLPQ